jgi:hypothetical protein
MAWEAIEAEEWESLVNVNQVKEPRRQDLPANVIKFPAAQISTDGLSAASLARLKDKLANVEQRDGRLTLKSIIGTPPAPPPPARLNAEALECIALLTVLTP